LITSGLDITDRRGYDTLRYLDETKGTAKGDAANRNSASSSRPPGGDSLRRSQLSTPARRFAR
jgi:hypothetical protein